MRRFIVLLAAACLVVGLPASSLGAQPTATTRISGAGAAFTASSGGYCYRMTITFLYDRYRAVQPEETPPGSYAQVTLSIDKFTSCGEGGELVEQIEETTSQGFEEGDSYLMNDLASAYVDIDWHAFADTARHFHIWLAWIADGPTTLVRDTKDPSKTVRQEVSAQLAGTVTSTLPWTYEPGSAGMGLGTYIFGPEEEE